MFPAGYCPQFSLDKDQSAGLNWKISLIGILALAMCLRFYRLGSQSLWFDECDWLQAWEAIGNLSWTERLVRLVNGLSLYDFLMGHWILLGEGEFVLRVPSAICGFLTVFVVYSMGAAILGIRTGLVAALLVALSPFHVWYSQEARPYALLTLMSTLSVLCLVQWLRKGNGLWRLGWFGASGLSILTFQPAVYLLLFQAAFLALTWRRNGARFVRSLVRPKFLICLVVASALLFPLVASTFVHFYEALTNPNPHEVFSNIRNVPAMAVPYTFFAFSTGFSLGPSVAELHLADPLAQIRPFLWEILFVAGIFGVAFCLGCIRLFADREQFLLLTAFLVIPITAMLALAIVTGHAYNVRYAAPSLVPYVLIVAQGLSPKEALRSNRRWWGAPHLCLAFRLVCCLLLAWSLHNYYFNPRYGKIDSRGVAHLISVGERPGDLILLSYYAEPGAFTCYYRGRLPLKTFDRHLERESEVEVRLKSTLTIYRRIWLVSVRPWEPEHRNVFPSVLKRQFPYATEWVFAGAKVYLLSKEKM